MVPVSNKVYNVILQEIKEASTLKDLDKVGNATLIIPLSRVDNVWLFALILLYDVIELV